LLGAARGSMATDPRYLACPQCEGQRRTTLIYESVTGPGGVRGRCFLLRTCAHRVHVFPGHPEVVACRVAPEGHAFQGLQERREALAWQWLLEPQIERRRA